MPENPGLSGPEMNGINTSERLRAEAIKKNHKQMFVIFQKTRSHGLQPVEWFTFKVFYNCTYSSNHERVAAQG